MTFGEKIKELRLRKDLGLREFCLLFMVDPSNWSKIERGRKKPNLSPCLFATLLSGLCKTEKEKDEVISLYYIARKEIPEVIAESKILLPLFVSFRDKKKLRKLAEFLQKEL
jgi:transcriptional regulator with XRE-family HTH domain